MRKFFAGTLVTAGLVLSTGLARADVEVGVIDSLSGTFAEFGARYRDGLEVALKEINDNGGINGEPVKLIMRDDASEARSALASVEELDNAGVPVIIGSYASSITGPMAQLAERKQIPLIVLGSAADSITKPGSPWVFRAKHNSTIVANNYFDYFDYLRQREGDDSLKTIAMLYGNGAWPVSLADEGKVQAEKRGYEVVADQAYDQGTTDFRPILNNFKAVNADILYVVSYASDGVAITRQMKEAGLNAKVIAIDTSAALVSYIEQVGPLAEYVVTGVDWSKDAQYEGNQDLYERLKAKAGSEPTFYEAEGYVALMAAADAMRRAKSLSREDVREALDTTVDLKTPMTTVTFKDYDGFQNQNPIQDLILQIQDGQHVTVFPEALAAAEPRFPAPGWSER